NQTSGESVLRGQWSGDNQQPVSDTDAPNHAADRDPAEGARERTEAMRNDARPMGEANPLEGSAITPLDDPRMSVTHDRQSHIVSKEAADHLERGDLDIDPTMPTGDSTLKTKI